MVKNLSPNPATWFVTGGTEESFTFEPGREMYVVSVKRGNYHMITILLFADSREHVLTILRDMCTFRLDCADRYTKNDGRKRASNDCEQAIQLLEYLAGDESKLTLEIETPGKNRVFNVSWACNDTIL